jgi:hypothetical protein
MRTTHGEVLTLQQLDAAEATIENINSSLVLPFAFATVLEKTAFGYMFEQLQNPESLLPKSKKTRDDLIQLGITMSEKGEDSAFDSATPSAYTYFGQFVDHDITMEAASNEIVKLNDQNLEPLPAETISQKIKNTRTPKLDLDSVYGDKVPRDGARMVLGRVSAAGGRPPGKDDFNDLPRRPRTDQPQTDREALIGDSRNDENLIIAQLHVAFLRAHNAIVDMNKGEDAEKLLRQHYQWIVIHDFLKRIADPEIVNNILREGNKHFTPRADALFMPLEFSVAAFRFGHSMIRSSYDFNLNFNAKQGSAATLDQLFTFTAFSGQLLNFNTLPENWIIEWKNFLDEGTNAARRVDTRLVEPLFALKSFGKPMPDEARLAVRNLLRGYLLSLPTGQAVASALNLKALTPKEIEEVARSVSDEQRVAIRESGFSERTPLWYYILAESAAGLSSTLGPVGSTIVAEVLIGLVRASRDSILREPNWKPTLGTSPGRFTLRDLLRLASVI